MRRVGREPPDMLVGHVPAVATPLESLRYAHIIWWNFSVVAMIGLTKFWPCLSGVFGLKDHAVSLIQRVSLYQRWPLGFPTMLDDT